MISRLRGRYNTVRRAVTSPRRSASAINHLVPVDSVDDTRSPAVRPGPCGYYAPRQLVFGVDRSGPPTLRTTGCVACIFTDGQQMRLSSTALASAVRNPIGQSNFRAMACSRSHPTPHPHPRNHLEHSEAACVVKFDRGLPPS